MTNEEIRKLFTKLTGITWDITALPDNEKKKAILTWLIPDGKILDNSESERAKGIKELMQELDLDIEGKFGDTFENIEEQQEPQPVETEATFEYIDDEASWNESFKNGVLGVYYQNNPDEDRWNTVENRACNFNDKVYELEIGNGVYEFAAHWETDTVQKITNLADEEEIYYLDMFYSLDEEEHKLFTDIALSESANKAARFRKVKWNETTCPQCWTGAVNAPGAQWPWVGITPEIGFEGIVKFVYDEGEPVYPFGEEVRKFMKGYGVVSVPATFGNIEFDESKLKVYYITFE